MFGKKNEANQEAAVKSFAGNVIEEGTSFKGELTTTVPLLIKGVFDGKLESSGTVTVAETGLLKGTAEVNELIVSGVADGEMHCNYIARITASGKVSGSLATSRLLTDDGSTFDGQLVMLQPHNTNTEEQI